MWLNPLEIADLVTFTEEILNGKLHFLCTIWLVVTKGVKFFLVTTNAQENEVFH